MSAFELGFTVADNLDVKPQKISIIINRSYAEMTESVIEMTIVRKEKASGTIISGHHSTREPNSGTTLVAVSKTESQKSTEYNVQ
jgi:hypothetical protein